MTDPAAIAAGLTKAQRECFMRGTDLGCVAKSSSTGKALVARGLAKPVYQRGQESTVLDWLPFGLSVRQHLHDAKVMREEGE